MTDSQFSKPMSATELEEIEKRHASTEQGWHLVRDREDPYHLTIEGDGPTSIAEFGGNPDDANASYTVEENALFAVHAHSDIPRLLAEVRRLQKALNAGANSADPEKILRLGLEQLRTNAAHTDGLLRTAETARDGYRSDLDFLQRNTMPELRREVDFQKGGKERWRDRALAAEKALDEIRYLHLDSPMGPCPTCFDGDAHAAGGDGLVPYPCPTGRLAGAKDCDPPSQQPTA
ncbi:hypothetical protein ACIOEX_01210 [Streptomyces sp. NPDC087850]|uniref:hypothetical protein n=1 Tax=Streptomyces sp. NPDC087850 TaxID=3365809 RepID=UPI0037FB5068